MSVLLSLTAQPARDTTLYAVKRARKKGSIISYDPNYRASLWPDEKMARQQMRSLIPYVDLMKISDEETELLTDEKEVEKAAEDTVSTGSKDGRRDPGQEMVPTFIAKTADVWFRDFKQTQIGRYKWSRRFFLGRISVSDHCFRETSGRADER